MPDNAIQTPCGSALRPFASPDECRRAEALPRIEVGPVPLSDMELLSSGAYHPVRSFLGRADYQSILQNMRLADGSPWPLPIQLPVSREHALLAERHEELGLCGPDGVLYGTLRPRDVFEYDPIAEANAVYLTADAAHPGVARLLSQPRVYVSGPVTMLRRPPLKAAPEYRLEPGEVRAELARRGWQRIVGFQTRNPVHRAHEYILKAALEICDGLLLHPLVGETKNDDVPADVRMESYRRLIESYFPASRVLLSVFPGAMRYAGPREAVFHALVRRNYGCTHFIVGRDHAGVGKFYGPYDAQRIFSQFSPNELGITPLFFEHSFYCTRCCSMASLKTCPHDEAHRLTLSGTMVRDMLARGEIPPAEYTRPEVAEVLIQAARKACRC